MRLVGSKNESIAVDNVGHALFASHDAFPANHEIEFPLRGMRVIGEIVFTRRNAAPFQIERMSLRQIERTWLAAKRLRDSFKRDRVFSAGRFPRLFLDLFEIYFAHSCTRFSIWKPGNHKIAFDP